MAAPVIHTTRRGTVWAQARKSKNVHVDLVLAAFVIAAGVALFPLSLKTKRTDGTRGSPPLTQRSR